ncbi:MAG: asparaginase [Candidatus Limnocylindrales bacterium]
MARVAIVFTGGTIASLPDAATGAAMPTLDGEAILARIPGITDLADLEPIDRGLVSASHMSFTQIVESAGVLQAALDRDDVDGAVLAQGTDSIEETAFAYDLLVRSDKPVVVVGAMRTSADPAWDGPRNLRDAVRVASAPSLAGQGALVVMGGLILPADDAVKLHSQADDAFGAPNSGSLGAVGEAGVRLTRERGPRRRLVGTPLAAAEPCYLVTATVGLDGSLVRAMRRLRPAGLVIAASGAGNTHPDLLDACREAMTDEVAVALTTRCCAGRTAPAYGFPGGGARWLEAGAMPTGHLGGPKARVALALGLGSDLKAGDLADFLADPPGWHQSSR